ncbi:MAG: hypothetical protein ABI769_15890 [Pseudomonadota bacterium]
MNAARDGIQEGPLQRLLETQPIDCDGDGDMRYPISFKGRTFIENHDSGPRELRTIYEIRKGQWRKLCVLAARQENVVRTP